VTLAIFDLDNTLIAGDSDYLWGQFLVEKGIVNAETYERANTKFYEDYKQGTLDIHEFLRFALKPLTTHDAQQLHDWRKMFIEEKIKPILMPAAHQLINVHRQAGHTLMIITATNRFVTEPIADLYGIEHLIATTPEFIDGRYTGEFMGTPCFKDGKVIRLKEWLDQNGENLENSWFYSDSHNDLPLLSIVSHAVAVDPDDLLMAHSEQQQWPVISLRAPHCPDSILDKVGNYR